MLWKDIYLQSARGYEKPLFHFPPVSLRGEKIRNKIQIGVPASAFAVGCIKNHIYRIAVLNYFITFAPIKGKLINNINILNL